MKFARGIIYIGIVAPRYNPGVSLCSLVKQDTHICGGNGARRVEEQSVRNPWACCRLCIETSKTFNLPPGPRERCLVGVRNSTLKLGWKTKSGLCCTSVLELGIFYISLSICVTLNELQCCALITDDDNCRSKITHKMIIIKRICCQKLQLHGWWQLLFSAPKRVGCSALCIRKSVAVLAKSELI